MPFCFPPLALTHPPRAQRRPTGFAFIVALLAACSIAAIAPAVADTIPVKSAELRID